MSQKNLKAILFFVLNFILFVVPLLFIPEEFQILDKRVSFEINKWILIVIGFLISVFSLISTFFEKIFKSILKILIVLYFLVLLNFGEIKTEIKNPVQGINLIKIEITINYFVYFAVFVLIIILLLELL